MCPEVVCVSKTSSNYPVALHKYLGDRAPDAIWMLGSLDLLRQKAVALFCSVKCPGDLILKTYDVARGLRDAGVTVISGFHSPRERECLDLLLRGKQPVIACAARRLTSGRLPTRFAIPVKEGRLLMISPFGEKVGRATADAASIRNELVAALADRVFISHAAHGSKTEALCRKVLEWGKPLLTFEGNENTSIIALGAMPCDSCSTSLLS